MSQLQGQLYFLDMGRQSYTKLVGRILTCRTDGSAARTLVTDLHHVPDGLAIDPQRAHIYWTNMGIGPENDGTIQRCSLEGTNIETVIPTGITHTPKQITIATKAGKLYWCDREGMRVMRANVDGNNVETLYEAGKGEEESKDATRWCVGIAVDEGKGVMYWTQKGPSKGGKGRIFRAGLELREGGTPDTRSDVETLFKDLPEPVDLELDDKQQLLYWTDRGNPPFGNSVNCASVAGFAGKSDSIVDESANHKAHSEVGEYQVLVRKLHEGIGLSLDLKNGRMFFGDLNGSIYEANLDGSDKKILVEDMGDLTGLAFLADEV